MKIVATLSVILASTLPAAAADSIADQAKRAFELYAGGLSQPAYLAAGYGAALLKDIGGNWVKLNGPDPQTGIETYGNDTEKSCKTAAALTLAAPNTYSMTLATNLQANNVTQVYTLVAGATFAEHTDSEAYLALLNLGPDKTGDAADQQRALVLASANGIVDIYRPSEDVLVITRDRAYPTVLARCPAS